MDALLSHPACRYELSGKGILPVEAGVASSLRPAARFSDAVAGVGRHVSRVRIGVNAADASPDYGCGYSMILSVPAYPMPCNG